MKVKAYSSECVGIIITGFHYYGEIVRFNKKSIRVKFDRFVKTYGSKTEIDTVYNRTCNFAFWKTIVRDGKMIDIYKNTVLGIIEIPV